MFTTRSRMFSSGVIVYIATRARRESARERESARACAREKGRERQSTRRSEYGRVVSREEAWLLLALLQCGRWERGCKGSQRADKSCVPLCVGTVQPTTKSSPKHVYSYSTIPRERSTCGRTGVSSVQFSRHWTAAARCVWQARSTREHCPRVFRS